MKLIIWKWEMIRQDRLRDSYQWVCNSGAAEMENEYGQYCSTKWPSTLYRVEDSIPFFFLLSCKGLSIKMNRSIFVESKWQHMGELITQWLKVEWGGRNKFLLSNQIMQNLQKVLEEMCKTLIGFMVLSLSLKGYFVSITLCWTLQTLLEVKWDLEVKS